MKYFRLKKLIKSNIKMVISFIMGGIVLGGIGVYASSILQSENVTYDNTGSKLTSTTMQGAIDELNSKANISIKNAEKKCPREYGYKCSKVCEKINGTGKNMGDLIRCGSEDFYILENVDSNIVAIARYNLEVGQHATNGSPTGSELTKNLQNKECIGSADGNTTFNGVNYNTATCATTYSAHDESKIQGYLSKYKTSLYYSMGFSDKLEVSIPSKELIEKTGCSTSSCPDWIASGSFWLSDFDATGSNGDGARKGVSGKTKRIDSANSYYPIGYGIRPIIKISSNVFEY